MDKKIFSNMDKKEKFNFLLDILKSEDLTLYNGV